MEWLAIPALMISIAAFLHTLYAGPSLVVKMGVMHRYVGDGRYVAAGVLLTLINVGRTALPITQVGVGVPEDGHVATNIRVGLAEMDAGAPVAFPLTLEPGHTVTLSLTDELVVGRQVKVIQLKRNWLLRPVEKVWKRPIRADMIPGAESRHSTTNLDAS